MIDVDGEATETTIHIRFAHDCGYLTPEDYNYFKTEYLLVGKMINGMIQHPEKFAPGNNSDKSATATTLDPSIAAKKENHPKESP